MPQVGVRICKKSVWECLVLTQKSQLVGGNSMLLVFENTLLKAFCIWLLDEVPYLCEITLPDSKSVNRGSANYKVNLPIKYVHFNK